MADYNPTPWDYEQQQVDEPAVATALVPTPAPGIVTIGQEDWRTGGPGPVPIPEGQGIRLTGGLPFKPEGPLPWWTIAYEQEKQRMADQARIQEMLRTVPVMQREKALESAKRMEGSLAYQADIQAGMSPQQALLKNAPNLFYNSQNALASVLRYGSRQTKAPFVGGEIINIPGGRLIRVSEGQYRLQEDKPEMNTSQYLSHVEKRVEALQKEREDTRRGSPERTAIDVKIKDLTSQADDLMKTIRTRKTEAAPVSTGSNKEDSRIRAKEYISKYPSKADAIRKRFRDTFNEDV